jgi:hypothetical protein
MSTNLSTAFKAEFAEMVKLQYQKGAKLNNTMREVRGVVGSTYRFDRYGKVTATLRTSPSAEVDLAAPSVGTATVTLADYNVAIPTDKFDQAKVIWSEVEAAARAVGMALGRRADQFRIAALAASTFNTTAGTENSIAFNISGTPNNAMNIFKLRLADQYLTQAGVGSGRRHIAMTAAAKQQLLGTTPVASSDYASVKALVNGELNSWLGFQFHIIETRAAEGGIAATSGTQFYAYAWDEEAVGYAEGIGPVTEIENVPMRRSKVVFGDLSAGAVTIEDAGVVRIGYDAAVVVATNEA